MWYQLILVRKLQSSILRIDLALHVLQKLLNKHPRVIPAVASLRKRILLSLYRWRLRPEEVNLSRTTHLIRDLKLSYWTPEPALHPPCKTDPRITKSTWQPPWCCVVENIYFLLFSTWTINLSTFEAHSRWFFLLSSTNSRWILKRTWVQVFLF